MTRQEEGSAERTNYEVFRWVLDDSPLANNEEVTEVVKLAERWLKRLLTKLPNSERGMEFLRAHSKLCEAISNWDITARPAANTPPVTPPKNRTSRKRKSGERDPANVGRNGREAKRGKPRTNKVKEVQLLEQDGPGRQLNNINLARLSLESDPTSQLESCNTVPSPSSKLFKHPDCREEEPEDREEEEQEADEISKPYDDGPSSRSDWTAEKTSHILKLVRGTLGKWSDQLCTRTLTAESLTLTDELQQVKAGVGKVNADTVAEHVRRVEGTHERVEVYVRYSLIELNCWFEARKIQLQVQGRKKRVGPTVTTELVETSTQGKLGDKEETMTVRKGWLRRLRAARRWNDVYNYFGRGILVLPTAAFDLRYFGDPSDSDWAEAFAQYKQNDILTVIAEELGDLVDRVMEGQLSGVRVTEEDIDEAVDKIMEGLVTAGVGDHGDETSSVMTFDDG